MACKKSSSSQSGLVFEGFTAQMAFDLVAAERRQVLLVSFFVNQNIAIASVFKIFLVLKTNNRVIAS